MINVCSGLSEALKTEMSSETISPSITQEDCLPLTAVMARWALACYGSSIWSRILVLYFRISAGAALLHLQVIQFVMQNSTWRIPDQLFLNIKLVSRIEMVVNFPKTGTNFLLPSPQFPSEICSISIDKRLELSFVASFI
jgi:hypothetical protein